MKNTLLFKIIATQKSIEPNITFGGLADANLDIFFNEWLNKMDIALCHQLKLAIYKDSHANEWATHGDMSRLDIPATLETGGSQLMFRSHDDKKVLCFPKAITVPNLHLYRYKKDQLLQLFILMNIMVKKGVRVTIVTDSPRNKGESRFYELPKSFGYFFFRYTYEIRYPQFSNKDNETAFCRQFGIARSNQLYLHPVALYECLEQWLLLTQSKSNLDISVLTPKSTQELKTITPYVKITQPLNFTVEDLRTPFCSLRNQRGFPIVVKVTEAEDFPHLIPNLVLYPWVRQVQWEGNIYTLDSNLENLPGWLNQTHIYINSFMRKEEIFRVLTFFDKPSSPVNELTVGVGLMEKSINIIDFIFKRWGSKLNRIDICPDEELEETINVTFFADQKPFSCLRFFVSSFNVEFLIQKAPKFKHLTKGLITQKIGEFFDDQPHAVSLSIVSDNSGHLHLDITRTDWTPPTTYKKPRTLPTYNVTPTFISLSGESERCMYERQNFEFFSLDRFQLKGLSNMGEQEKHDIPCADNLRSLAENLQSEAPMHRFLLGKIKVLLKPTESIILPTLQSQDGVVAYHTSNPEHAALLSFYKDRLGWNISFSGPQTVMEIKYILKTELQGPDRNRESWTSPLPLSPESSAGLPGFRQKSAPPPHFLLDPASPFEIFRSLARMQSRKERVTSIIRFCRNFSEGDSSEIPDQFQRYYDTVKSRVEDSQWSNLKVLLESCRTQKGVCRHRSEVFLFLMALYGLDAVLVKNKLHAFGEVLNRDQVWESVDFGGGEARVYTNYGARLSDFELNEIQAPQSEHKVQNLSSEKPQKALSNSSFVSRSPVIEQSLPPSPKPKPRWQCLDSIESVMIPEALQGKALSLILQTEPQQRPVFVIASLKHLDFQLKQARLDEAGLPKSVPGPLAKALIAREPFHLVIILSGFEAELAKINGALDRQARRLGGHSFHENCQVTVFVHSLHQVAGDITSRIGEPRVLDLSLLEDLSLPSRVLWNPSIAIPAEAIEIRVDLENPQWRTPFFEGVKLGEKGFEKETGLFNADLPLALYIGTSTPPPDFVAEMAQLNLLQGKPVYILNSPFGPKDQEKLKRLLTRIRTVSQQRLPEYLTQQGLKSSNSLRTDTWIKGASFSEETRKIVRHNPDFSGVSSLFITEALPLDTWIWLAHTLPSHIFIVLGPNVKLPLALSELSGPLLEETEPRLRPSSTASPSSVLLSTSPSESAKRLPGQKWVLSAESDVSTELVRIQFEFSTWTGTQCPTPLLEALMDGKPLVFLGVKPGSSMWRTLEPLLIGETHITVNGKEIETRSSITLVLNAKHRSHPSLSVLPCVSKEAVFSTSPQPITFVEAFVDRLHTTGIVAIDGNPGSGKTGFVDRLLNSGSHLSFDFAPVSVADLRSPSPGWVYKVYTRFQLDAFFNETPIISKKVLVIDDIDTLHKGALSFLKGMLQEPPTLVWKGQSYEINPTEKAVILIGDSHSDRIRHGILKHIPCFTLPATSVSYRNKFHDSLVNLVSFQGLSTLEKALNRQGAWLCDTNRPIYEKIFQFFQLGESKRMLRSSHIPDKNHAYWGKNGLRIEGPSGFGKSTAVKSVFLAMGLKLAEHETLPLNPSEVFFQITPQSKSYVTDILDHALLHGIRVILDEYNLIAQDKLECYLNGTFPIDSPHYGETPKGGFQLYLTGNDPYNYASRIKPSKKLIDQTEVVLWGKHYSESDLMDMASQAFQSKIPKAVLSLITEYGRQSAKKKSMNPRPILEKFAHEK